MPLTMDNWCVKRFLFFLACVLPLVSGYAREPLCDDKWTTRTSEYMMYLGCYNHTCFQSVTRSTVMGIDECIIGCKNDSYQSAALSHGDTCYCGSFTCKRNDTECDSKCGVPCSGVRTRFKTCGGKGFIQVYMHDLPFKESPGPYHLAIYIALPVLGTLFIIAVGVITISLRSCLEERPPSTAVSRSSHRSDSTHRYSTYIIDDSRGANGYQEMNLQSIRQPGYQDDGYQTVPEGHRIPVAGTSDHGACADQKAGSAKHATFDTSGYSDTDEVQSSHEYAYIS